MDNEYLDIIGLGIFKALNDKRYPILVNGKISESAIPTSITNSISSILSLIPDAASSENKLADKNFVNSSIATNTATFRGTFDDLATLQATSADINDYAFYVHTDEIGNTAYDRYKHNGSTWVFEYTLNNSSFTAVQWSAINSGITTTKVGNYDAHLINYSNPHKVTKSQVGLGDVENVALSSWAGSNKITTLGTITTGVWNGTKITNTYLANSSITIGTTAISLGSTAKSLAGIEKLQLNDANSNLVYDSTTGSWKLTGNLLVTGFISAGAKGNSSSGGGSTYTQREWAEIKIMSASEIGLLASAYSVKEAYNELNTAIETLAGKATNVKFTQTLTSGKQIGSISIDGKSTSLFAPANYAWSEITGKPTFATVATSGSYTDLTNKPTIASLMGSTAIGGTSSYLYWNGSAWATKALGSNAFTSISKVSQLTNDSGYITGITKAMVEGVLTGNITSHTHSYLPLSGGTMSNTNVVTNLNADLLDGYQAAQVLTSHSSATVDLNEISVPSIYRISTENPNLPSSIFDYGNLLTVRYVNSDTAWQLLGAYSSDNLWFRRGSWSADGTGTLRTNAWKAIAFTDSDISGNAATATNADLLDGYHASSFSKTKIIDLPVGQALRISMEGRRGFLISMQAPNGGRNALYFVTGYGDGTTIRNDIRVIKGGPYDLYFNGTSEAGCVYIVGTSTNTAANDYIYINPFDYNDITYTIVSSVPSDAVLVSSSNSNILATLDSNVASASKWANARTITLTGSVTGSVSIDGSGDVSLATTTNHTHTFASLTDKPTTISGYGITDAYTKTQTDTKLSGYLPLSGGTISGPATTLVNFNSTGSESGIRFQLKNVSEGWAGYNDTYGTHLFIYADVAGDGANHTLGIRCNGNGYIDSNTILHSGNYNSYAPKLDGTGASGTWGISISGNAATATNLTSTTVSPFNSTSSKYKKFASINLTNRFAGKQALLLLNVSLTAASRGNSCKVYVMAYQQNALGNPPYYSIETDCDNRNFEIYAVLNYTSTTSTIELYAYGKGLNYHSLTVSLLSGTNIIDIGSDILSSLPSGTVITPTKYGSVYSATKLANSRTIWGQSFDGTGNVSGEMSDVETINFVGNWMRIGLVRNSSNVVQDLIIQANGGLPLSINPDYGNVGIGTTSPSYKLDVNGQIRATSDIISNAFVTGNSTYGSTYVELYGSTPFIDFHYNSSTADYTSRIIEGLSGQLTVTGKLRVGLGYTTSTDYALHIVGTAYSSAGLITDGAISAAQTSTSSDIRLKDDISEISSEMALKWLSMLKPKAWSWNSLAGVKGRSMGFVAQDVEGVLPQMIRKNRDNGFLSLDYTQLHALEVSALQSHEKRIEELERENKILKEELNKLKQYAN